MIITVYDMDGYILDTPDAYLNDDGQTIYKDISAMEIRTGRMPSVKFIAPIDKKGLPSEMSQDAQLACIAAARKIDTLIQKKMIEDWRVYQVLAQHIFPREMTVEGWPKLPGKNRFDLVSGLRFPEMGRLPFPPPKLPKPVEESKESQ